MEKLYNEIIKKYPNKETTNEQLEELAKKYKIKNFKGVYSYDNIPRIFFNKNNNKKKTCIVNLDGSTEPGSHWIALYVDKDHKLIYDSFARLYHDDKPEQDKRESNCGYRCVAFLVCAQIDLNNTMKELL